MNAPIKIVIGLFSLNFVFGVIAGLDGLNPYITVFLGVGYFVAYNVLVYEWCGANSSCKALPIPFGAKTLTAVFAPLGLAYYFFVVYRFFPAIGAYMLSLVVITLIVIAPSIPLIIWGNT
ncbi:hypothetical protein [Teredinibacter franksiae]|uniref:hypothetical protein n=1 Tax=Teredinibacter franksiae TaxID=2761453 RepID=UPI001629570D|nr:hypothetical protein [Teredinibacter franksiae]